MIHHLIHKIAVVTDHDDASLEIAKVFLQHLQRDDVEVVGRFVEHQEVGILHEDGAEIETTLLTAREFIDIALLCLGREHEML